MKDLIVCYLVVGSGMGLLCVQEQGLKFGLAKLALAVLFNTVFWPVTLGVLVYRLVASRPIRWK